MNQPNPVLLTLQQIEQKLGQRFTLEQTTALVEVFDSFRQMELRHAQDTAELKQAVARLAKSSEKLEAGQARLTEAVAKLAEAQARTEQRLDKVEIAMAHLVEAQARTEQRLDQVEERLERLEVGQARLAEAVAKLTEAQARTEQRLDKVEERLDRLEVAMARLAEAQARTEAWRDKTDVTLAEHRQRMDKIIGLQLEQDYARKASAYFGRALRRVKVVSIQEIEDDLAQHLSDAEIAELMLLDLLVRGQPRQQPDAPEVWLAVEISAKVDKKDAVRAQERAALLQKAGYRAIPTLAGEKITQGATQVAAEKQLFLLQNGQSQFWNEALQTVLS